MRDFGEQIRIGVDFAGLATENVCINLLGIAPERIKYVFKSAKHPGLRKYLKQENPKVAILKDAKYIDSKEHCDL